MKNIIFLVAASLVILIGGQSLAYAGGCGGGSCDRGYTTNYRDDTCGRDCCSSGCNSCGDCDSCDNNISDCQCTDPSCGWTWEKNCMSQSTCCEAFGNIGAR